MKNLKHTSRNYLAFVLSLLLLLPLFSIAQVSFDVDQCETEEDVIAIVDSVLLGNVERVFKKNITFTGNPKAVGYYTQEFVFGFAEKSGVVMSTGFANSLADSNSCISFANGATGGGSDTDLETMGGMSINDACVIEFDLMLFYDSVYLSYVFGSEEYHEWVNPLFADVFGFFLSGPDINGPYTNDAINISSVPGTNDPVSIGHVNCGDEDQSCTQPPGNGSNCNFLYDNTDPDNYTFSQTTLDAYTVQLTTHQEIQSYEWYHFKLVIGDAGDNAYDSGVLLEKGSVISIPVPSMDIVELQDEPEVIQYIDEVLLSNFDDENKANISFSGDPKSVGYFDNTEFLNLDENNGLLLTNGHAIDANVPNECGTSSNASTNNDGLESDPDLAQLADNDISGDVGIIEFDFRPTTDTVFINYVFASEEYHDMISNIDFDVFGIFLSGPGIDGEFSNNAVNIATVPGEGVPVNSFTINMGEGGLSCSGIPDECENCQYLIDNSQKIDTAFFAMAYDAYTTPMYAGHEVEANEWYHLKIAVADVGTEDFDSGIFFPNGALSQDTLTTSVPENTILRNVQLRPNPAKKYVEIQNDGDQPILEFSIFDINGRQLVNMPYIKEKISLTDLPKGLLIIEFDFGAEKARYKLIHQ